MWLPISWPLVVIIIAVARGRAGEGTRHRIQAAERRRAARSRPATSSPSSSLSRKGRRKRGSAAGFEWRRGATPRRRIPVHLVIVAVAVAQGRAEEGWLHRIQPPCRRRWRWRGWSRCPRAAEPTVARARPATSSSSSSPSRGGGWKRGSTAGSGHLVVDGSVGGRRHPRAAEPAIACALPKRGEERER